MNETDKPSPRRSPLGPTARSLPIALLRAREKVVQPYRAMLGEANVTEQQWRVLRVLYEDGELEANQVADRACLFMSSLTRIAQTLITKGYIDRRPNPEDRRRLFFSITPAGKTVIDVNAPTSQKISDRLRRRFGDEKLEELLDLLIELDRLGY